MQRSLRAQAVDGEFKTCKNFIDMSAGETLSAKCEADRADGGQRKTHFR